MNIFVGKPCPIQLRDLFGQRSGRDRVEAFRSLTLDKDIEGRLVPCDSVVTVEAVLRTRLLNFPIQNLIAPAFKHLCEDFGCSYLEHSA